MRRFFALIICIFLLAAPVGAVNALSSANTTGSVTASGSCQITMSVTIRLDEPVSSLLFPLGSDVSGVSLNGGSAKLKNENGVTCVNLNYLKDQTGSFPLTIHFTLNNVVSSDENTGKQNVTVPLLYGFKYPVEAMSFAVTMPGPFDASPVFLSGYHEQDIERSMTYQVDGSVISGSVNTQLKDSETLFLTLEAPEGMFPPARAAGGSIPFDQIAMGVCAALAIIYWLATMGRLPNWPIYRSTPPEGISAGLVGSYLARKPADLTMMVVHWAQLGYLIMHLDDNGRVILHKKMDMGNERSAFEQRCFKNLFAQKRIVDATGYRYARLCQNVGRISRRYSAGYRKMSGNPMILQVLATGVGLFAGLAMGDLVSTSPAWRIIWMTLFCMVTTLAVWQIQKGMFCLRLYGKSDLVYGLIAAGAVLGAGLVIRGALPYAAIAVGWGFLAGIMGAYGGKRTENGVRTYSDLMGLRRYMRKVTKVELARILRSNPDYYYELAPFAIALGVDKKFAKQFGSLHIPSCTWLATGMAPPRTASEWVPLLREAVESMNALNNRPFWEKFSK